MIKRAVRYSPALLQSYYDTPLKGLKDVGKRAEPVNYSSCFFHIHFFFFFFFFRIKAKDKLQCSLNKTNQRRIIPKSWFVNWKQAFFFFFLERMFQRGNNWHLLEIPQNLNISRCEESCRYSEIMLHYLCNEMSGEILGWEGENLLCNKITRTKKKSPAESCRHVESLALIIF